MRKAYNLKTIVYVVFTIILIAALSLVLLLPKHDNASLLRESGYRVEINNSTFRGFASQKLSADKGDDHIVIQTISGVPRADSDGVLRKLNEPIQNILQKVVLTDPYTGRQQELSVPKSLKPAKETIVLKGNPIAYTIVYTNDIFSMKIFSEAEAKNKGIFSAFYCPNEQAVFAVEIYSDKEHFDKQKQITLLTSLYCK